VRAPPERETAGPRIFSRISDHPEPDAAPTKNRDAMETVRRSGISGFCGNAPCEKVRDLRPDLTTSTSGGTSSPPRRRFLAWQSAQLRGSKIPDPPSPPPRAFFFSDVFFDKSRKGYGPHVVRGVGRARPCPAKARRACLVITVDCGTPIFDEEPVYHQPEARRPFGMSIVSLNLTIKLAMTARGSMAGKNKSIPTVADDLFSLLLRSRLSSPCHRPPC